MPNLFNESITAMTVSMLNLHGLPGSGKTGAALSLSSDWPSELRANKRVAKPVTLHDVIYIGEDKGGLDGFHELGVRVKYALDVGRLLSPLRPGENRMFAKDVIDAQSQIGKEVRRICATDGRVKFIIRDTVTRMDKRMQEFWNRPENMPSSRDGTKDDTQSMWRIMLANHMKNLGLFQEISGVMLVNLFHSKALEDVASTAKPGQQARAVIARLGSQSVRFIPDLSGQSLNAYTGDAIELGCTSTYDKTKKSWSYFVHPNEGPNGERTKNRLRLGVTEKFPASELRSVLQKVKMLP